MTVRRRFSPRKAARNLLLPLLLIILVIVLLTGHNDVPDATPQRADVAEELQDDEQAAPGENPHDSCLEQMPEGVVRMKVNYFGSYAKYFNDSNYVHLAEAEKIGIRPLTDARSCWQLRRPIVRINSCEEYYVDSLTYSSPYLVREAAAALKEIGTRFRDSIAARGGGDYRVKVTSVLRTPHTVALLRRRNRNAIDSSVHRYGTTFDISYAKFAANSDALPRSSSDLQGVLAEVLKAMRQEGKIWVKYERHQPCFHITARGRQSVE